MNFSAADSELENAYQYCKSVTRLHAGSFYFAAKFLPESKQRAVYPIYAFCRHVDDEIDEIGDGNPTEAIEAVKRWRNYLRKIYPQINTVEDGLKTTDQSPKTRSLFLPRGKTF